jgi:DNA-binding NarL/FixJ family response regulator
MHTRTLVLEDDRFFQEAIKKGLSMVLPDGQVDICVTNAQAIECVNTAASPYSLAIIDLELPDGNGLAVIRHITHTQPKTPIMVLSVTNDEKRVLEAVRAGAIGYIVKGDISLSIPRAIEQLMNGLHPISPSLAGYFLRLAGRDTPTVTDSPIERLTPREMELLRQFAHGKSYREAAQAMGISVTTIRTHTSNLYRKLGVRSGLRALSVAKEHGLI